MKIDERIIKQLEYSLKDIDPNYIPLVLGEIEKQESILGPLCSLCSSAEMTIDFVYQTASLEWWYLINITARCTKTCKEYLTHQIYLDEEGIRTKIDDKVRYHGKIVHKFGCISFEKAEG